MVSASFTWVATFRSRYPGKALWCVCQCRTVGGTSLTRGARSDASGFTLGFIGGLRCSLQGLCWISRWKQVLSFPEYEFIPLSPKETYPKNKELVYGKFSTKSFYDVFQMSINIHLVVSWARHLAEAKEKITTINFKHTKFFSCWSISVD